CQPYRLGERFAVRVRLAHRDLEARVPGGGFEQGDLRFPVPSEIAARGDAQADGAYGMGRFEGRDGCWGRCWRRLRLFAGGGRRHRTLGRDDETLTAPGEPAGESA